jgi:hypothetical protein
VFFTRHKLLWQEFHITTTKRYLSKNHTFVLTVTTEGYTGLNLYIINKLKRIHYILESEGRRKEVGEELGWIIIITPRKQIHVCGSFGRTICPKRNIADASPSDNLEGLINPVKDLGTAPLPNISRNGHSHCGFFRGPEL